MSVEVLAVGVPVLMGLIGLILRSRKGRTGLWDVLHELAQGRVKAGLERERRATLVVMLEQLPKAGLRVEDTVQGRRTVIAGDLTENSPRR
ncbi:hypothetical protein [Streptomyces bambusae]|uniref:Uncharacterized protein n=1 Tax=Streptomyces bambusae TaxID=1550616 RepID=A0ABS6Z080_9ACTN|nr:hypothetical protein [Streptomyces bambusae]MBW5481148.1 hypothetical protein [Streptomyces bambusae]